MCQLFSKNNGAVHKLKCGSQSQIMDGNKIQKLQNGSEEGPSKMWSTLGEMMTRQGKTTYATTILSNNTAAKTE